MNQIAPVAARSSEYPVDALFLDRWSPRAFDGAALSEETLLTILEAAHWAPSAFNAQPWRFVYALKGAPEFNRLLGLLFDVNQSWAKNAGALVFIVSRTHHGEGESAKPIYSHSFDAGAAWALLALQAQLLDLHAHAMTGLHFDRIPASLGLPEGYRVEAAAAIGARGDAASLPEPLRARETPSARRPLAEVAFRGVFEAA